MIVEDRVITEDRVIPVLEVPQVVATLSRLIALVFINSTQIKKGLFDQKPEGIPEELLNSDGAIGAMARLLNTNTQETKSVRRLIITNLPTDYQESVSLINSLPLRNYKTSSLM